MNKKVIVDKKEYVAALSTLRDYFGNPPPFSITPWKEMTKLLQSVCKYEIDVLGMNPKWEGI